MAGDLLGRRRTSAPVERLDAETLLEELGIGYLSDRHTLVLDVGVAQPVCVGEVSTTGVTSDHVDSQSGGAMAGGLAGWRNDSDTAAPDVNNDATDRSAGRSVGVATRLDLFDEGRTRRRPSEGLSSGRARRALVEKQSLPERAEFGDGRLRAFGDNSPTEPTDPTRGLADLSNCQVVPVDTEEDGSCFRSFQSRHIQPGEVVDVNRAPVLSSIADDGEGWRVADRLSAGDDVRDAFAVSVHDTWLDQNRADAGRREGRRVDRHTPRDEGWGIERRLLVEVAGTMNPDAAGAHEGRVALAESGDHRLGQVAVRVGGGLVVGDGGVNRAVCVSRELCDQVAIAHVAQDGGGTCRAHRVCRRLRAHQRDDVMAAFDERGENSRADVSGATGQ